MMMKNPLVFLGECCFVAYAIYLVWAFVDMFILGHGYQWR
jgi:hypothetical protein